MVSTAPMIFQHGSYELDDDPKRVDVDAAWAFLSTSAYWARWRQRADFEASLPRPGGWWAPTTRGPQRWWGLPRAISDGVSIAYLADVYVLPEVRGVGLGKALVATMIERGSGSGFRWMLHTADAHGLYREFGFGPPDEKYLERARQD